MQSIVSYFSTISSEKFIKAVYKGDLETVNKYLSQPNRKLNVIEDGKIEGTPLVIAAYRGHLHIVKAFIAAPDINLDVRGEGYDTPLIAAVARGHYEIVETLIKAGANLKCMNNNRETAFIKAIEMNDLKMIKILHEAGADINQENAYHSALHTAVLHASCEVVQYLIDNGAEINRVDGSGNSEMLKAMILRKFKVAQILFKAGADFKISNNSGLTLKNMIQAYLVGFKIQDDKKKLLLREYNLSKQEVILSNILFANHMDDLVNTENDRYMLLSILLEINRAKKALNQEQDEIKTLDEHIEEQPRNPIIFSRQSEEAPKIQLQEVNNDNKKQMQI